MTDTSALIPYLPRMVVDWLDHAPEQTFRTIDGTGVLADISGFTDLTERLARKGKVGAEEMGDVLNAIFEQLLGAAYDFGAGLIKWGGDAVLLLFEGEGHAERACRASFEMQRVIGRIGRIKTSSGTVRLRMSIGVHSGELDFLLVGSKFRELIVTGPGATQVADMETIANAGEVVVSEATSLALGHNPTLVGEVRGSGRLLVSGPDTPRLPSRASAHPRTDLRTAFSAPLSAHLLGGKVDNEHRNATVSFIEFSGVDLLRATAGPGAVAEAVDQVVSLCQEAADAHQVTYLASDIYQDGGKIILISGAPTSAGDDETRVLTAVRHILDAPSVLPLKAGVNAGRLFAGDYGPSYRRVYSICGDCVNLAARLMGKAEHGQMVASTAVVARSRTTFALTALEPFAVKGKQDLIEAVTVGPILERAARSTENLPLIGRQREMELLLSAMASATRGEGQTVEIVGEPGIGKSRLLEELVARSEATTLWSDGDIYATSTPYLPLRRLFRHQLGLADDVDSRAVIDALTELIAPSAPHLLPLLPLIGIVVGVDFPSTPDVETLDPEVRKEKLEMVTSEALGALLSGPTLFIFNDVHFMDEATVDLLHRFESDVKGRPWLVVTTRRPQPDDSAAPPDVTRIDLQPLGPEAADALMAAATDQAPLPAHRMQALIERAGGNPLFLRELVAGAGDLGEFGTLPDSVEAMIAARIDRLRPPRRRLLRSASVLGMTIDLKVLSDVLSVDGGHREEGVDGWDDLGEFLVPTSDGNLAFAHHLIRETAYEGLPFRRRILLHGRAADVIEMNAGVVVEEVAELLSLHSFVGERYQAAWEYSRLAGERARERYANAAAADFLGRALAAATHLPHLPPHDVADVCEALSDVRMDLDEFGAAEDALASARRRAGDDVQRVARLRLKTSVHRHQTARYGEALRWATRGRAALAQHDDSEARALRAKLAQHYAYVRFYQGRLRQARVWSQQAAAEARLADDVHTEARALEIEGLAIAYAGEGVDQSRAGSSLKLYIDIGDLRGQARAHCIVGLQALAIGDWNVALDHYASSVTAYASLGRQLDVALQEANQAEILVSQGRLHEAASILADAMRIWRGTDAVSEMAFGQCQLARVSMARGELPAALALLTESRRTNFEIGETHEVQLIDALMAECHLLRGDPAQALRAADEALAALPAEDGVPASLPLLQRVRGLATVALGDAAGGRALLWSSLMAARERQARHEIWATLDALIGSDLAHDADELSDWVFERSELKHLLGIRSIEAADPSLVGSS